jgi:SAM-dependent methyltransferase
MKWFVNDYASKMNKKTIKVLDVGSYSVNGSYKDLFNMSKFEYTGLDMEKGPNVDIVINKPYDWSCIENDSYDIVISGQTFEHVEFFWITMTEMTRVLKMNGLICLIVPNELGEHRYPVDCYRFYSDGMVALARYVNLDVLHAHTHSAPIESKEKELWYSNKDSMLVARKGYSGIPRLINTETYNCIPSRHEELRKGFVPAPIKKYTLKRLIKKILSILQLK